MRKPLSPQSVAELNAVLRRACERMEEQRRIDDFNASVLQCAIAKAAWADVEEMAL